MGGDDDLDVMVLADGDPLIQSAADSYERFGCPVDRDVDLVN